jgi:hypothetical protein
MPRDHRRGGGCGSGGARARGPGESESESAPGPVSALVCQGCGRGFASLRSFNGHHSSPYVRPQCQGRDKGVDQDMVVTSRDVRVRSRVRVDSDPADAAEAQGTSYYMLALYKHSTHNVHEQSMQNTYHIHNRYK